MQTQTEPRWPVLTAPQLSRVARRGIRSSTTAGQVLYAAGDAEYDFVVVVSGEVDVLRPTMPGAPEEELIATFGPGQFLGELNLVTGQTATASARVRRPGAVHRLGRQAFRELMAEDAELLTLVLPTLLARREVMRRGEGARVLQILGSELSPATHSLRTWAARQELPHTWVDIDQPTGLALSRAAGIAVADLPAVITPTAVLKRATAAGLADHLGLAVQKNSAHDFDLVVVGGGPAGLAAAVYGASEGLGTVLVDRVSVGGQAASSSLIENYMGFPAGLTGIELTSRALAQAAKFGARVSTPVEAVGLECRNGQLQVLMSDSSIFHAGSVIVATGARYRTLPLEGWSRFEGAGIYYAATDIEARACAGRRVSVLGGANSAGQAALFLAERGGHVDLLLRGSDLGADMSHYLVERIRAHPQIEVRTETQCTALHGSQALLGVTVTSSAGNSISMECHGLFCFIGAVPATAWLPAVALDPEGFIRTDRDLTSSDLGVAWDLLGRTPLPFETSIPGVFAAGDVRSGAMKRVAAAVGEGASAVRSVHQVAVPRAGPTTTRSPSSNRD